MPVLACCLGAPSYTPLPLLLTPVCRSGNRAMGRHVITEVNHLLHGHTYLIRRGAITTEQLREAEEEERGATRLQRRFRERKACRKRAHPHRYLAGWGLASERELLCIAFIQDRFRALSSFREKIEKLRMEQQIEAQVLLVSSHRGSFKPLKPEQTMKMQGLALLPDRLMYTRKDKPGIVTERPMLRSAHEIFSCDKLAKHKRWTQAVTSPNRCGHTRSPPIWVTPTSATGSGTRTSAKFVHGRVGQSVRRPASTSSGVGPTTPMQLSPYKAGERRPQSARADFSATKSSPNTTDDQNPSPPITPGRAVRSAPPGARRIGRLPRRTTMPEKDLSTFGGIQQRSGRFASPSKQERMLRTNTVDEVEELDCAERKMQTQIPSWWLEEKARAQERSRSNCDRPAWDTSRSLAR